MIKYSPIKQRIIQYVDLHFSSRRDFYTKAGISRGTLENQAGITEDTLTKVFATNSKLSPTWVITGEGSMLTDDQKFFLKSIKNQNDDFNDFQTQIKEKDAVIKELKEIIVEQRKIIMYLVNSSEKKKKKKKENNKILTENANFIKNKLI